MAARDLSRRFPKRVYGVGDEPDPRFSLANERTYLAWTRTSLTLFAAGVALEALDVPINADLRLWSAGLFVVLGVLAAVEGLLGWLRTERALRMRTPLSGPSIAPILTVGMIVGVALVAVGLL
ncbi:YidH family protein [Demequina sp. SO4-18]|uniref:YidH family protein n=1 Tax=Demequina sp. SO4-18 TaxID=3401026 RepID=UPI003B5AB270